MSRYIGLDAHAESCTIAVGEQLDGLTNCLRQSERRPGW